MNKQSTRDFFKRVLIIFAALIPFVVLLFLITTPGIDENNNWEFMSKFFIFKYILLVFVSVPFILGASAGGYVGHLSGPLGMFIFLIIPLIYVFVLACFFEIIRRIISQVLHKR